jgi:hypothetical protein
MNCRLPMPIVIERPDPGHRMPQLGKNTTHQSPGLARVSTATV